MSTKLSILFIALMSVAFSACNDDEPSFDKPGSGSNNSTNPPTTQVRDCEKNNYGYVQVTNYRKDAYYVYINSKSVGLLQGNSTNSYRFSAQIITVEARQKDYIFSQNKYPFEPFYLNACSTVTASFGD